MFNVYRPPVARRLGKTVLWSGQEVTTATTAASSKVQFKNFSPSRFANLLILPLLYKIGNGRIPPVLSRLESVEDSAFTYFCRVFHKQPSTWQRQFRKSGKPCPSFLQICVRIMCVTQSFLRNSLFLGKENENLLLDRNCTVQFR